VLDEGVDFGSPPTTSSVVLVTGAKSTPKLRVLSDASFGAFNDRGLDFDAILSSVGNQTITGRFSLDHLTAGT